MAQAIQRAAQLHQQGRLDQAEIVYADILASQPNHFDARHLLGVLRFQQGRNVEALADIRAALNLNPAAVAAWSNFGLVQAEMNQPAEALTSFDRALALKPDHVEALYHRGNALIRLKRPAEALASYDKALALKPDLAEALNNRGIALVELKRAADALASFDRALALKPRYMEALFNRGVVLGDLKRAADAVASFEETLVLKPDHAEALYHRGNALMKLKRPGEAVASYDKALTVRPDHVEALNDRGVALKELKRFAEAVASYDLAIALGPDYAEAFSNRGTALIELNRPAEALASCDRALALKPGFAEAFNNRGLALFALSRLEDALASFDEALRLKPDYAEAFNNRGTILMDLQRPEAALANFDQALALRRDFAQAFHNRGFALSAFNRLDEALASFDQAIALNPEFADARFANSVCLLLRGDFDRGWREYEWRKETDQLRGAKRDFSHPLWLGDQDLGGKTILLHSEQGFGDTIQFCRFAKLVERQGANVVLEVQPQLRSLIASIAGSMRVIAKGDPLDDPLGDAIPQFDYHCPLMTLPLAFKTTLNSIPADIPYLFAAEEKTRLWRDRLGPGTKPRIGLVWAGSPRKIMPAASRIDRLRSIEFDQLAPLFAAVDCEFYSLQKGDDAVAQLRRSVHHNRVVDWTDELGDFSDTAALIASLDLVIAVDTAVAHLVGALGKPLWLLNRFNTCWRWLLDRDDSPWYPTARIFRQPAPGDWTSVIENVASALPQWSHARSRARGARPDEAGPPSDRHLRA